ncbi:hypothetical protein [uncultured Desulfobulbus sp.]|uniref:hypothetical protein n=1 Tax=uncultured Desulfobulbus sp. TaxID=239745 RepID=UPI0029C999AD|nr:hypothetical protein [uncultured Desulfobulbus sp.]
MAGRRSGRGKHLIELGCGHVGMCHRIAVFELGSKHRLVARGQIEEHPRATAPIGFDLHRCCGTGSQRNPPGLGPLRCVPLEYTGNLQRFVTVDRVTVYWTEVDERHSAHDHRGKQTNDGPLEKLQV